MFHPASFRPPPLASQPGHVFDPPSHSHSFPAAVCAPQWRQRSIRKPFERRHCSRIGRFRVLSVKTCRRGSICHGRLPLQPANQLTIIPKYFESDPMLKKAKVETESEGAGKNYQQLSLAITT